MSPGSQCQTRMSFASSMSCSPRLHFRESYATTVTCPPVNAATYHTPAIPSVLVDGRRPADVRQSTTGLPFLLTGPNGLTNLQIKFRESSSLLFRINRPLNEGYIECRPLLDTSENHLDIFNQQQRRRREKLCNVRRAL